MLPKITDRVAHGKLKKHLGISSEVPNNLSNHWDTFREIVRCSGNIDLWYNEILVFSEEWLNPTSRKLVDFHRYMFNVNFKQSKLLRDSIAFSLMWISFSEMINKKGFKPRAYIIDTIRYLISIATGSGVGFKPVTSSSALPISTIQKAYMDIYELKLYIPTLMQPTKLEKSLQVVYYSLAYPITLDSSPLTRGLPSIIKDEREIKLLLDLFLNSNDVYNIRENISNSVGFAFFHTESDKYRELMVSENIINDDQYFKYLATTNLTDRVFCANAHFFRGCTRVTKK